MEFCTAAMVINLLNGQYDNFSLRVDIEDYNYDLLIRESKKLGLAINTYEDSNTIEIQKRKGE